MLIFCFLGGALQSDAKASGHSLQWTKALISKTTPYFEGTAVVNGQMKELKVTDYRGKYLVFFFYPLAFILYVLLKFWPSMIASKSSGK